MCVYEMGNLRVIVLSKILDPATDTKKMPSFSVLIQEARFRISIPIWT